MNNYQESPVTIDNDDYFFANVYHEAYVNSKTALMAEIGKSYVKYMEEKLHYFEQKSIDVFEKEIPQTLLIHASLLNAHYIDELAEMFIKNGYTFISQKEILKTPEYQSPISVYSQKGQSWIFRWGLSKGMDASLMDNDIEIPQQIVELAK